MNKGVAAYAMSLASKNMNRFIFRSSDITCEKEYSRRYAEIVAH